MANKIHPAKAVLVAALVAAGAFGAVTYNQAKSHLSEVAAAEKGWRQFPSSPPLSEADSDPGIKPLKTVAAWVNSRQVLARSVQSGDTPQGEIGPIGSFLGDLSESACDVADGAGTTFVVTDLLPDPSYRFMAARAVCDAALANKYLVAKQATEAALAGQPSADSGALSVGLIEGSGGQYLNEKIYTGPFVGFAKEIASKSGRPVRVNPFALNIATALNYDLSGKLGSLDDVLLVKPGNLSALLINKGWRPVAQATNSQGVVLVGAPGSGDVIASGDFSVSMTSYQALLGRGAWALLREMVRSDLMPNSNGGRSEFTFHATQEKVLRSVEGNTIGAVSPAVLEKFLENNPEKRFQVLGKSQELTHWMVLAHPSASRVPESAIAQMRSRLIAMGGEAKGKEILQKLNIKGFEDPNTVLIDATERMVAEQEEILDPVFKAELRNARRAKFLATVKTPWQAKLWGMEAK